MPRLLGSCGRRVSNSAHRVESGGTDVSTSESLLDSRDRRVLGLRDGDEASHEPGGQELELHCRLLSLGNRLVLERLVSAGLIPCCWLAFYTLLRLLFLGSAGEVKSNI